MHDLLEQKNIVAMGPLAFCLISIIIEVLALNPTHILTSYLLNIHINIILPSTITLYVCQVISDLLCIPRVFRVSCMSCLISSF
jgi:uncharacterized protein YacL